MKYFLYDEVTGKIQHYGESPDNLTESFIPGLSLIDAGEYRANDTARLVVVGGQLTEVVPPEPTANSYQIKAQWQALEQSPIQVLSVTVDCDPLSELRLKNTIDNWSSLPDIPGQMETAVDGTRVVYWSMVEGKVPLTLAQLTAVYTAMIEQRAIRAAILFSNYQRIKALPSVTLSYLANPVNWGLSVT